jgi:threonine dehydratase
MRLIGRSPLALSDVELAAQRLSPVATRTPVLRSPLIDGITSGEVLTKAECLQRTGSFKFRGAWNAVGALPDSVRSRGLVCFSTGNHGAAVAEAARIHQVRATVVMPEDAPAFKREAVLRAGAEVVSYNRHEDDREAIARARARDLGATLTTPCDDLAVIAGQGTVALELLDQAPGLDIIVVPVGGGGLLAGCAAVTKALGPGVRVIGVEPKDGDDTLRSLRAGRRVEVPPPETILDGQRNTRPAALAFEIHRDLTDEIVLVSDSEVRDAMRVAFEALHVVAEPSGAAALAAVLHGRVAPKGGRVGVILSGGNVSAVDFAALTSEADLTS